MQGWREEDRRKKDYQIRQRTYALSTKKWEELTRDGNSRSRPGEREGDSGSRRAGRQESTPARPVTVSWNQAARYNLSHTGHLFVVDPTSLIGPTSRRPVAIVCLRIRVIIIFIVRQITRNNHSLDDVPWLTW